MAQGSSRVSTLSSLAFLILRPPPQRSQAPFCAHLTHVPSQTEGSNGYGKGNALPHFGQGRNILCISLPTCVGLFCVHVCPKASQELNYA